MPVVNQSAFGHKAAGDREKICRQNRGDALNSRGRNDDFGFVLNPEFCVLPPQKCPEPAVSYSVDRDLAKAAPPDIPEI